MKTEIFENALVWSGPKLATVANLEQDKVSRVCTSSEWKRESASGGLEINKQGLKNRWNR